MLYGTLTLKIIYFSSNELSYNVWVVTLTFNINDIVADGDEIKQERSIINIEDNSETASTVTAAENAVTVEKSTHKMNTRKSHAPVRWKKNKQGRILYNKKCSITPAQFLKIMNVIAD